MPGLAHIFFTRWKLTTGLTLAATVLTVAITLIRTKQYGATATALPANSSLTDKARIFNNNVESLYPELGPVDELDRIEGLAKLDTTYIHLVKKFHLVEHYGITDAGPDSLDEAVAHLEKAAEIRRSEFGELKIKVWDKNASMAAQLANQLLQELNNLYRQTQMQNNQRTLEGLKSILVTKRLQIDPFQQKSNDEADNEGAFPDTVARENDGGLSTTTLMTLPDQIIQLEKVIDQYELGITVAPQPLLVVEYAKATNAKVKPNVLQAVVFAVGGSFLFAFLLSFYLETRKRNL